MMSPCSWLRIYLDQRKLQIQKKFSESKKKLSSSQEAHRSHDIKIKFTIKSDVHEKQWHTRKQFEVTGNKQEQNIIQVQKTQQKQLYACTGQGKSATTYNIELS